jgi:hypothetical protein
MGMIPRSDVCFTTHTNVHLGPEPTVPLAFWKLGPFNRHCQFLENVKKVGGNTEQKGQEVSVSLPKVSP